MPAPACTDCGRFHRPKKTGGYVLEMMPIVGGAGSGKLHAGEWTPYKLWMADIWQCMGCGRELATGWGKVPLAEHYQPQFAEAVQRATIIMHGMLPRIYDC